MDENGLRGGDSFESDLNGEVRKQFGKNVDVKSNIKIKSRW